MRMCPSHRLWFSSIAAAWLWSGPFVCAADKKNNGDELFTNSAVRHLRIEISSEGMQTLRKYSFRSRNDNERTNVPATVREGKLVWTNVAVHLKGAYGSFQPVDRKPALTLNFDKWADGQKFHGLQKISLNNSLQDPAYVSEKVCREIYIAAGVPTPRADYATVELNGRFLGLFVLTEGWNKQFLKRYFDDAKGNFYDLGGGHDVNKPLPAAFGENPTDHAMLKGVTAAANEPDHAKRIARLRATVDLDRFISLIALDCLMWNWDGYAMNRNNYRMFHDLDSNRLVFFPHGVDQMFWKANGPMMTGRSGIVAKSLLETAEGRRLYLERLAQIRAGVFDMKAITNEIALLTARLQPVLAKNGVAAIAQQQSAAMVLRHRIVARARDIDEQLAGVKNLLQLKLDQAVPLTNWVPRQQFGRVILDKTTDAPPAVHVKVGNETSFGAWTSTVWLEEGRYRIEGRIKTHGVRGGVRNEAGGAGFRVWSERKETRGASWSWFPYGSSQDRQLGGLIPVMTNALETRLTGDTDWTAITHEFELRQPVADLQIQCVLQAATGEAWFDLSSLKIRRTSLTVSKSTGARGE